MLVTISNKELHRLPVIQAVVENRLRRRDAASQLNLTERQVQRLMNRFRADEHSSRYALCPELIALMLHCAIGY